jgi:hypothetical protein
MTFDAHNNFAYSTIATAPSPALSGTSLTVATGDGALMPAAPFNMTVWPSGALSLKSNAEIVRVTAVVGDVLTIARTQESSSARSIVAGDQIAATITAKTITDIEGATTGAFPPGYVYGLKLGGMLGASTFTVDKGSIADSTNAVLLTNPSIQTVTIGAAGALGDDSFTGPGAVTIGGGNMLGSLTTFLTSFNPQTRTGTISTGGATTTTITGTGTTFTKGLCARHRFGRQCLCRIRLSHRHCV